MDENDPILSQQNQVVSRLVDYYAKVTVITGRIGQYQEFPNLTVINSNWIEGKNITNALRFLYKTIPILIWKRPQVIFSHMTEVQSFLISLISYFLRIKHFLWYAHKSRSFFLWWNHKLLNGIITSTLGSCPIGGSKIHVIGQAVDSLQFPLRKLRNLEIIKLIHIGRFDRSKNVSLIIEEVQSARKSLPKLMLTLIGSSSNSEEQKYADAIQIKSRSAVMGGWLNFKSSVSRSDTPSILKNNDCFIHAYQGSLDKTLIEATLVGLPVVTINFEYHAEFGSWDNTGKTQTTLSEQIQYLSTLPADNLASELMLRREIAVEKHSLERWIEKLMKVLN